MAKLSLVCALLFAASSNAWTPCMDGALCPENPTLKDIGNRNADACVECGTAYNQSEPWQAEWLTAEFGNDASQWPEPEECSQYGTGCICRDIGETCYSDFPVIVDIWLVISGLWMVYLTWLCVTFWRDSQAKRKKGAKLSSMEKIVMLCLIANGMRVVWYIVVIPGRNPSTVIGGKFLEPLLLKIPQLLWMGSYFYMASTWKMLFDQAQTMKKANPKEQEALDRLCNRVNGSIIGIVVPMYVVGTAGGIAILTTVVNLITLILIIALLYGAVSFGMKLTKELGTDGPGAALGAVITRCIQQSVVGALTMIIGLVLNIMGMTQTSPMFTFAFWMMVHGPECLVAHALLFTKISQGKNKIKSAKTTTTTATSSSVAPES